MVLLYDAAMGPLPDKTQANMQFMSCKQHTCHMVAPHSLHLFFFSYTPKQRSKHNHRQSSFFSHKWYKIWVEMINHFPSLFHTLYNIDSEIRENKKKHFGCTTKATFFFTRAIWSSSLSSFSLFLSVYLFKSKDVASFVFTQ